MKENQLKQLLDNMSIDDKIIELLQLSPDYYTEDGVATGLATEIELGENGIYNTNSVLNVFGIDRVNKIKAEHVEKNKHHIPMMFMADIIHGVGTVFPVPLAIGCSFDPDLVQRCYSDIAAESSAMGIDVTFAPMVDLVRDPRWGRVVESTGEDPYLNSVMCASMVKGLQGDGVENEGTMCACVKHYAAYGAPEGGRDYNTVDISERSLRQDYLPAYKAGVDAGAEMIMTSFNAVGGVPSTGNRYMTRGILRNEWGYDRTVITDWSSSYTMLSHGVAKDRREAAKLSIEAGVDIEMCSPCYLYNLKSLINDGEVDQKLLDEAVWRVLNLKNKLGLFENPLRYGNKENIKKFYRCEKHLSDAKEMACASSVMLKNDGILPLSDKSGKIAFIGPYVKSRDYLGSWVPEVGYKEHNISFEEEATSRQSGYLFAEGSSILGKEQQMEADFLELDTLEEFREEKMLEAVEVAKQADTVVMLIGESYQQSGESRSRSDIRIPDVQLELLRRVCEVNKNIAVILFGGRPLDLREILPYTHALIDVWFPGSMGAKAIYDMLYGIEEPSGRLCMTFPYSVGQIPTYYNYMNTDHPYVPNGNFSSRYIDIQTEPMFAFGEGMGYTKFEYCDFMCDSVLTANGSIKASVTLKNVGDRAGKEVVQLYIRDLHASVTRPIKELKGFKKVYLEAGEATKVEFEITPEILKIWDINMQFVAEPGIFRVFIGHDSNVSEYKEFELK